MSPRICVCCGEPMAERGNALSRNPNLCASCSSLADGMEDANLPPLPENAPDQPVQLSGSRQPPPAPREVIVMEWVPQGEERKPAARGS